MMRCSVLAREELLQRLAVDRVAAGTRLEDHTGDAGLALAGRGVARASGQIDRDLGDRLARDLRGLLLRGGAGGGLLGLSLRGGASLGVEELAALGNDVRNQVGTRDRRLLARRLLDVLDPGPSRRCGLRGRLGLSGRSGVAACAGASAGAAVAASAAGTGVSASAAGAGVAACAGASAGAGRCGRLSHLGRSLGCPAVPRSLRSAARRSRLDLHRLRLLGGVRMIGPCIDLQLGELLARKAIAGEHPLHRNPDDLLRRRSSISVRVRGLQSSRVARVAVVTLVLELLARYRNLSALTTTTKSPVSMWGV